MRMKYIQPEIWRANRISDIKPWRLGKMIIIGKKPKTTQPNTSGIVEAKEERNHNDIGGTNMAIPSMVFSSSEHVYP